MPHGIKPIQTSTIPLHYSFMFWLVSKSSWARMSHGSSPSPSLTVARFHRPDRRVLYVPRPRETDGGVPQYILVCWHICWGIYLPPHLLALLSPDSLSSLLFFPIHVFPCTPSCDSRAAESHRLPAPISCQQCSRLLPFEASPLLHFSS